MAAVAPAARPAPRNLRVGLFADARAQPRWLVEAFARVAASDFAEIALIAIVAGGRAPAPGALARAYGRLDRWAFGAEPSEPLDLPDRVLHKVLLIQEKEIPASKLDLDVAFALGGVDERPLAGIARLGVWRYALDGVREVAEASALTASRLTVRLAGEDAPRIAYESWSRTYPLSVARNRRELLHKAGEFAFRALREAHRSGQAWLEQCPSLFEKEDEIPEKRKPFPVTSMAGRIVRRGIEKALWVEQWMLAFRFGGGAIDASLTGFTAIVPPMDRDWADPFPLEKDGRYYVFFEERPHGGKGHIAVMEIDRAGRRAAPRRVLETDHHLSYPFLLEDEGRLYMIPEAAQSGAVALYRCTEFPHRWEREALLLEGVRLVDPTLHRSAERWWLFANAPGGRGDAFDDELHLFHAPRLQGPWQPHERNPVRSDVRAARPAGGLFFRDGVAHRPAQICVPRYGAGLAIHRVLRLTPGEYAERQVECIVPGPPGRLLGLHTVNRAGQLTAVDSFTRRRRI